MTTIQPSDITSAIGNLSAEQSQAIITAIQNFINSQYNLSVNITPTIISNALTQIETQNSVVINNIIANNIIDISGINSAIPDQTTTIVQSLATLVVNYLQNNLTIVTQSALTKSFVNILAVLDQA